MAPTIDAFVVLDLLGAGLLAATGAFVLIHAAQRQLSAVFFVFAGADAAATILYRISLMDFPDDVRLAARGAYWWFLIVAVGALAAFGLLFPRPIGSRRTSSRLAAFTGALTLACLGFHTLDRSLFWQAEGSGATLLYRTGVAGHVVLAVLGIVVAALLLRAASIVRQAPTATHADQASFVFGGVILSYGTIPASLVVLRAQDNVLWSPLPRALSTASFLLALAAAVAAVVLAGRARGRARNVLLGSVGFLALLMLGGWAGLAASDELQTVGIFVGPVILAYAILRYAVFDVDARVRRAVSLGLGAAGVAGVFVTAEGLLQNLLQDRVFAGLAGGIVATAIAGLLAAALMLPVAKLASVIGRRIVPVSAPDTQHARKLEIYRHALEGARMSDGIIDATESGVLARLRESLGISEREHAEILGGSAARA